MDVVSNPNPTDCDEEDVTPDMIEAGLSEFLQYDPDWGAKAREVVADIYRAMRRAKRARPTPSGEPLESEAGPVA